MYQIIVDPYLMSQSVYDEYNSYNDAKKALDDLVVNNVYDAYRLCIVPRWQGGNTI